MLTCASSVPTEEDFKKNSLFFFKRNYQIILDARARVSSPIYPFLSIENLSFPEIQNCVLETLAIES